MKSNKEKFKKGQKVKIIEALYGNHKEDRIGKIKSFNNAGEIWVDFPDGSGGLVKKIEAISRGRRPLNPEIKKKREKHKELYKQWIKLGESIFLNNNG